MSGCALRWDAAEVALRKAKGTPVTRFDHVARIAAASCGLGAAALALLVPLLGGALEPVYSHRSQFISELGASGAANAALVSAAGFAPIGALLLGFLALGGGFLPGARRTVAGVACLSAVATAYLAAAVFPCDAGCPSAGSFSQSVHNAFGFFEYAGALAGLVLLASAFRASASWRALAPVCVGCALAVAVGFAAMLLPELASVRGASQRLAEAAIFLWVSVVSVFLLRARPDAARAGEG